MNMCMLQKVCTIYVVVRVVYLTISHRGESNPRTSDLESDTLAPYQQAVITECGLRYKYHESITKNPQLKKYSRSGFKSSCRGNVMLDLVFG